MLYQTDHGARPRRGSRSMRPQKAHRSAVALPYFHGSGALVGSRAPIANPLAGHPARSSRARNARR
eukprot:4423323-Alexandrium_andersonii.AAC.1